MTGIRNQGLKSVIPGQGTRPVIPGQSRISRPSGNPTSNRKLYLYKCEAMLDIDNNENDNCVHPLKVIIY